MKVINWILVIFIAGLSSLPTLAKWVYIEDPDGICTNRPMDPDCLYYKKYRRYSDEYSRRRHGHYDRSDDWKAHEKSHGRDRKWDKDKREQREARGYRENKADRSAEE